MLLSDVAKVEYRLEDEFGVLYQIGSRGIAMNIIGAGPQYWIDTATAGQWGNTLFWWYANNNLMVMSVSAMFIIAVLIWIQRSRNPKLVDIS